MLPQFSSDTWGGGGNNPHAITRRFLKAYLFKMFRPHKHHMDFDLALFLMKYSLKGPNKLYLHTKRLKQIKNQWHRDDPCLTAVIIFSLFILGFAYA
jgi:hypothetical protein